MMNNKKILVNKLFNSEATSQMKLAVKRQDDSKDTGLFSPPTQVHISHHGKPLQYEDGTGSTFESPFLSKICEGNSSASTLDGIETLSPQPKKSPPKCTSPPTDDISKETTSNSSDQFISKSTERLNIITDKEDTDFLDGEKELLVYFYIENRKITLLRTFSKWKKESLRLISLNKICNLTMKQKEKKTKRIYLNRWLKKFSSVKKTKPVLKISCELSHHVPLQIVHSSNEMNSELLDRAQSMNEEIAILRAKIESVEKKTADYRMALEESIKNESKIKSIVSKLTNEKQNILERISSSEAKYEEDIIQFMLKTKLKTDERDIKMQEIKKENIKKDREIKALKQYAAMINSKEKKEKSDLENELKSEFEVVIGLRQEISRLKNDSTQFVKTSNFDASEEEVFVSNQ